MPSRIRTVENDLGIVHGQTEHGAEIAHILNVNVGLADDGDGLAGAVDGGIPQWQGIVYGREVVRAQGIEACTAAGIALDASGRKGELGLDGGDLAGGVFAPKRAGQDTHGSTREIV